MTLTKFKTEFEAIVDDIYTIFNRLDRLRDDIAYELFEPEREKYYTEIEYHSLEKNWYKINKIHNSLKQTKVNTIGIFNIPNKTPKTNVVVLPVNSEDIEVYDETVPYEIIQKLYEKP